MSSWSYIEGLVTVELNLNNAYREAYEEMARCEISGYGDDIRPILDGVLENAPEIFGSEGSVKWRVVGEHPSYLSSLIDRKAPKGKRVIPFTPITSVDLYVRTGLRDTDCEQTKKEFEDWLAYMRSIFGGALEVAVRYMHISGSGFKEGDHFVWINDEIVKVDYPKDKEYKDNDGPRGRLLSFREGVREMYEFRHTMIPEGCWDERFVLLHKFDLDGDEKGRFMIVRPSKVAEDGSIAFGESDVVGEYKFTAEEMVYQRFWRVGPWYHEVWKRAVEELGNTSAPTFLEEQED